MIRELRHKREECSNLSNEIESLKNENDRLERKLKVAQSEYEEILAQFNSEKEQMAHKEQLWDRKLREVQAEEERQKRRLEHQISMVKHEQQGNLEKIRVSGTDCVRNFSIKCERTVLTTAVAPI
eukprot:gb/GECG01005223.1/.p1 GENE.gb/GECG01005223.1/~~gb/GECG01005223.1/.p1  ORF type:complete len:125 (+),score=19.04 gb/GECG01005223.1/:1-375(+)